MIAFEALQHLLPSMAAHVAIVIATMCSQQHFLYSFLFYLFTVIDNNVIYPQFQVSFFLSFLLSFQI